MAVAPLTLTVLRQGETITMDLTEVGPLVPRRQIQVEEGLLTDISTELTRITTAATTQSVLGMELEECQSHLQQLGTLIFAHLFPTVIQQRLCDAPSTSLFLRLDDQLVHIPWELAFDGQEFLLTKFAIGRQVITDARFVPDNSPLPQHAEALRMLIIADPTESLAAAAQEADQLCGFLEACNHLEVSVLGGKSLRKIDLLRALNAYDLVHYAGHAYFDATDPTRSGWVLDNTVVTASELSRVAHPPLLVFANACQAGTTARWQTEAAYEGQAFGIGSAFLLAGVQNYIGTFCVIHDVHSARFAADFYQHLVGGAVLGEALRAARHVARQASGVTGMLWASYLHYGNPTFHLSREPAQKVDAPHAQAAAVGRQAAKRELPRVMVPDGSPQETPEAPQTTPEPSRTAVGSGAAHATPATAPKTPQLATRSASSERQPSRNRLALGTGVLVVLLGILMSLISPQLWKATSPPASILMAASHTLEQGHWADAETLFQQASAHPVLRVQSQGQAGLAAVTLARGEHQRALDLMRQAERAEPASAVHALEQTLTSIAKAGSQPQNLAALYIDAGYMLEQLGKDQEAVSLYQRALQIDPHNFLTTTLLREAKRRAQLAQDSARQQHLDHLVAELVQAHKEGKPRALPEDEWTSTPLTLAFLPWQPHGSGSTRAGAEEGLMLGIMQMLQDSGRVTVVERELLDKLLGELKLSASELVDPQVALRLGRLHAARLLITGSVTRVNAAVQLSMRLIETETARLVPRGSLTEVVEKPEERREVATTITQRILNAVRRHYPLQGRIAQYTPQVLLLDIGAQHGVSPGLTFHVFGPEESLDIRGKRIEYSPAPVGRIAVSTVDLQLSQARILEQSEPLQQGWKVREVQEQQP